MLTRKTRYNLHFIEWAGLQREDSAQESGPRGVHRDDELARAVRAEPRGDGQQHGLRALRRALAAPQRLAVQPQRDAGGAAAVAPRMLKLIQGGSRLLMIFKNTNTTRTLARNTCILLYFVHGPLEHPFTKRVL